MPEFKIFGQAVTARFNQLSAHELFVSGEDTDELWATYLEAFPPGTNPMFKTKTEHDCSCCRNFVKNLGNAVAIVNGEIQTIWDVPGLPSPYREVAAAMNTYVLHKPLKRLFRRSEPGYGAEATRQTLVSGETLTWNHFYGKVAARHFLREPGPVLGEFDANVQVFRRGLEELQASAFETVVDLIGQRALYRGEEHLDAIKNFQKHVDAYALCRTARARKIYIFANQSDRAARFRNTVIGTLIVDISEGTDVESAVKAFESKVAPLNYKRTTALITPKMVDAAMAKVGELGLDSALARRYAGLSDISVNNLLWINNEARQRTRSSAHEMLMQVAVSKTPQASKSDISIGIDEFLQKIAPKAQSINVWVRNQHSSNFVSLTTAAATDAKPLFRWENNFGWSYDGNITDSIKEKVKRAGGNTSGALRFSLEWFNYDDLDIHCKTPRGEHIYFGNKQAGGGILDVDMNAGGGNTRTPVENIAFGTARDGVYELQVKQYSRRETIDIGFGIEIADAAGSRQLSYKLGMQSSDTIDVAKVTVKGGAITDIKVGDKNISADGVSQVKWGVTTETWVPVSTIMYSPNYWDDQGVGNKHWFFMLANCGNPETTRGIYNEFLSSRLEAHRKVFEVLGNKSKCPVDPNQLSGLGFSSTRNDTLMVQTVANGVQSRYTVAF